MWNFFADEGEVKVKFYRLILLGVDESAQGQVDAVVAQLKKDGIYDTVKERLLSVTSDSANVMSGSEGGFAALLAVKFGLNKGDLIMNACLAHKNNLMIRNAVTKKNPRNPKEYLYWNPIIFESDVNDFSSFFRYSHKNMNFLRKKCIDLGLQPFKPKKIIPNRWSASYFKSIIVVKKHFCPIVVTAGIIKDSPMFALKQQVNARNIDLFVRDKHALTLLHFQLDISYIYKGT